MIREATREDIPEMVEMCARIYGRLKADRAGPFNSDIYAESLAKLIGCEDALVLRSNGGVAAAIIYRPIFTSELTAQEILWWSTSGDGFEMVRRMEEWARGMGVRRFRMTLRESRAERALLRSGYVVDERHYMKEL